MTPEISAKLAMWRQKCALGTITRQELNEAIDDLRKVRHGAATVARASTAAKARGTAPGVDVKSILGGLGEMVKK
jgi:hypothetical protein